MPSIYTDGGRRDVGGKFHAGYGLAIYHDDGSIETHQVPLGDVTNNHAEVLAVLNSLKIMLERKLTKVRIYSDSRYTVDSTNKFISAWSQNGWLTKAGRPIKNLELWKEIYELKRSLGKEGLKFKLEWCKAHTDDIKGADVNPGNVLADKMATLALYRSSRGEEPLINVKSGEDVEVEKKKKLVASPISGLLNTKRLYFRTNSTNLTIPGRYYTCKFVDKELDERKRPMEGKFFGCPAADSYVAVVQMNEPDPDIEMVIAEQNKVCANYNDLESPCLIWLDKLTEKKTYNELLEHKEEAIQNLSQSLFVWGATRLTRVMHTAYMAFNGANNFEAGDRILTNFVNKTMPDNGSALIDITDMCFEFVEGKKKTTISPLIKAGCQYIDVDIEINGKTSSCRLTPDIDIPTPINFGKIAKQSESVKVFLYVHDIKPNIYRIAVIIETDKGTSVSYSPDSSYRIYKG